VAGLKNYIAEELAIAVNGTGLEALRGGSRAVLKDEHNGYSLGRYIAGQLPHHYRTLEGITADFASGTSALEAVLALAAALPDSPSFQNSHGGEILAAHFVESHLGFRRLYSKLTLLSSQNTNAHKMDALFVRTSHDPFEYLFVEAKSSILPTEKTKTKSHRSGILKQMIESLETYGRDDPRFELSRIRDNLESKFTEHESIKIRADLVPPGPDNLRVMGVSVINAVTVNTEDDDFILCEPCETVFDYYALVVTDLASTTTEAYGIWSEMKKAAG